MPAGDSITEPQAYTGARGSAASHMSRLMLSQGLSISHWRKDAGFSIAWGQISISQHSPTRRRRQPISASALSVYGSVSKAPHKGVALMWPATHEQQTICHLQLSFNCPSELLERCCTKQVCFCVCKVSPVNLHIRYITALKGTIVSESTFACTSSRPVQDTTHFFATVDKPCWHSSHMQYPTEP